MQSIQKAFMVLKAITAQAQAQQAPILIPDSQPNYENVAARRPSTSSLPDVDLARRASVSQGTMPGSDIGYDSIVDQFEAKVRMCCMPFLHQRTCF